MAKKKVFPQIPLVPERVLAQRASLDLVLKAFQKKTPPKPKHPLIYGAEYIGCGYDVFGKYGSAESVKQTIFDLSKTTAFTDYAFQGNTVWSVPDPIQVKTINQTQRTMRTGKTIREYAESLSVEAGLGGKFMGFGAEVKVKYNTSEWYKTTNCFTDFTLAQTLYSLRLDPATAAARALLTPAVKKAIDTGDPNNLFSRYGTHILTGLVMGGKLTQVGRTNVSEYKSTLSVAVAAEASFDLGLFGASANLSVAKKSAAASYDESTDDLVTVIGGSSALQPKAYGSSFDAWIASIPRAPEMIDFTPTGTWIPLTPIWSLASSAARRQALATAFTAYAQKVTKDLDLLGLLVADLQVIHGEKANISPTAGFEKIGVDLNMGSGGEFIYLCVQKMLKRTMDGMQPKPLKAVVDLAVVFGKNAPAPAGFTKIGVDLNLSVGGEFIYLCFKRGDSGAAIRDIIVVHGNDATVSPPQPYIRIAKDLNKGAGGQFIYVCYAKV